MNTPDAQAYPPQVTDAVKRAPELPGVYVMQDHDGHHLYVGKARNLKKRLASYFGHRALPNRVAAMVLKVERIELHVTHTEVEALLLESNLIKAHQPRYNIMLRDDKSYPYIRLSTDDEFPGLSFYRGSRNRPGQFFGPYSSAKAVRETLSQLQKIFPVRQCENTFFRNRSLSLIHI